MIRVAAVGDVHVGVDSAGRLRPRLADLAADADLFLLAEAVDRGGADLALHGHAHRGSPSGATPGGVTVRNVAAPVIGCAYQVFHFDSEGASA